MDVKEALLIFGLNFMDLADMNEEKLRRQYRKLVKHTHPDKAGRDVALQKELEAKTKKLNNAFTVLVDKINDKGLIAYKNDKKPVVIITLNELISLYDGKTLYIEINNQKIEFTRASLRVYNTLIEIEYQYQFETVRINKSSILVPWNVKDMYEIPLYVEYSGVSNNTFFELRVLDKKVDFNMQSKVVNFVLRFDKGVTIKFMVERVISSDK